MKRREAAQIATVAMEAEAATGTPAVAYNEAEAKSTL